MKKHIPTIIILIMSAVIFISIFNIAKILFEYSEGKKCYDELQSYVIYPDSHNTPNTITSNETDTTAIYYGNGNQVNYTAPVYTECPQVDFESLKKINPDIVGWIFIKNTPISYPIVQGKDNNYYLNHLFNKKKNSSGAIFLDCGSSPLFDDKNIPVYGHHMNNGTMFAVLDQYEYQAYYDSHNTGVLLTPDGNFDIEIFSAYTVSAKDSPLQRYFEDKEFESWLTNIKNKSVIDSQYTPTTDSSILTLSTCNYEFKDARFIVHAALIPHSQTPVTESETSADILSESTTDESDTSNESTTESISDTTTETTQQTTV